MIQLRKMGVDRDNNIIESGDPRAEPEIRIVRKAEITGPVLGVFSSSFNPPTLAHFELIRRAAEVFSLDEILALAGKKNADKVDYECSLEHRLSMIRLTFAGQPSVSIGLSSQAFYVDMISALRPLYPPQTDLHFIVGFDTFERVLDFNDRYTRRYNREFKDRIEALEFLFSHSKMIVAGRAGSGLQRIGSLVAHESVVPSDRVFYLDFPADLGELSATEVRRRCRNGESIKDLVPEAVHIYIRENGLYRA